jgi:hypothetical protein
MLFEAPQVHDAPFIDFCCLMPAAALRRRRDAAVVWRTIRPSRSDMPPAPHITERTTQPQAAPRMWCKAIWFHRARCCSGRACRAAGDSDGDACGDPSNDGNGAKGDGDKGGAEDPDAPAGVAAPPAAADGTSEAVPDATYAADVGVVVDAAAPNGDGADADVGVDDAADGGVDDAAAGGVDDAAAPDGAGANADVLW